MIETVWGGEASPIINNVIGEFVADRVFGDDRKFIDFTSLGVVSHETLIAGVVYHNFCPQQGTIEISASADDPRWFARHVIYEMYEYPFEQLDCRMVIHTTSELNKTVISILRRLGFSETRIEAIRGPNEAEIIFTLTKEQWKSNGFHKEHKNGQKRQQRTETT